MPLAIVRRAANGTPEAPTWDYLFSLRQGPLAWLGTDGELDSPAPEIALARTAPVGDEWTWTSPLLKAGEFENAFTLEPTTYRRLPFADRVHHEYDGDGGETVRFGDGTFGTRPDAEDVFEVVYRVGAGAAGNVAAGSITVVDPAWTSLLTSAWNPFPASGGDDREPAERVRRLAPQAFRARQFRAVRAEDYEAEAERLPWVQQAGTAFRWTGSWLTVFTTADPRGGLALPLERHTELIHLLNRRRLAGYESYVPPTRYVSIDLRIVVCATAEAFRGDVERDVLDRLGSSRRATGASGFFFADHFTFGTPLERSRLEAAIQGTAGVAGVLSIEYRRRGYVPAFVELPDVLPLAVDEILRIDNDPDYPERGALRVVVRGGK
jgi:predicted phage baseplate assembly protein